ncbi:hypothetical protein B0H19DRAFT_1060427 [Mycena capillaripes]|nr:hypothetical protein B0H19DRAFT_1060427 [Mycena capillaripes]
MGKTRSDQITALSAERIGNVFLKPTEVSLPQVLCLGCASALWIKYGPLRQCVDSAHGWQKALSYLKLRWAAAKRTMTRCPWWGQDLWHSRRYDSRLNLYFPPPESMDLAQILNEQAPGGALVDISCQILSLTALLTPTGPVLATLDVQNILDDVLSQIFAPPRSPQPPSVGIPPHPSRQQDLPPIVTPPCLSSPHSPASEIGENIKINRQTAVSSLHTYGLGTSVEYPQTSATGVGHLFLMDPCDTDNWPNPIRDFAYSLGEPKGYTRDGFANFVEVLMDKYSTLRVRIDPTRKYVLTDPLTGKGVKICPHVNQLKIREPHSHATRALLQQRFRDDRQARIDGASLSRVVFQKTAALVAALRKLGCSAPLCEETIFESDEEEVHEALVFHCKRNQRGCEHYSKQINKDHYLNTSISDGSYELSYLEAIFAGDDEEVSYIEEAAIGLGFGLLVDCTTVCNTSSQRTLCLFDHRDENGELIQLEMESLPCDCIIKAYVPFPKH